MNPKDLEDSVSTRLATRLGSDAIVINLPEDMDGFKRPVDTPRLTVGYDSSDYSPEVTIGAVMSQPEVITVIVTVQAFSLREDTNTKGIYTLKEIITSCLLGWTPPDCDMPIKLKYFGPPNHDPAFIDNMWYFELHFTTRTVAVQTLEPVDEQITANFTRFTSNDILTQPLIKI